MLRSYSCTHTDKGPRASRRPTDHDDNDNTTPTFFKGGGSSALATSQIPALAHTVLYNCNAPLRHALWNDAPPRACFVLPSWRCKPFLPDHDRSRITGARKPIPTDHFPPWIPHSHSDVPMRTARRVDAQR